MSATCPICHRETNQPFHTCMKSKQLTEQFIGLLCKSLAALAESRLNEGDKTVHDDIQGAIKVIVQLHCELTAARAEVEMLRKDKERLETKLGTADEFIQSCRHHHGNHSSNDSWWFDYELLEKYNAIDAAINKEKV